MIKYNPSDQPVPTWDDPPNGFAQWPSRSCTATSKPFSSKKLCTSSREMPWFSGRLSHLDITRLGGSKKMRPFDAVDDV